MADHSRSVETPAKKSQAGQWKLIITLVIALVALNWPSSGDETDEVLSEADLGQSIVESASGETTNQQRRQIVWPNVTLERLLAQSPFGPGPAASETTSPEIGQTADSGTLASGEDSTGSGAALPGGGPSAADTSALQQLKVQMVFRGPRGNAAVIDGRVVYEGDQLRGYQIAAIDKGGVTLRPAGAMDSGIDFWSWLLRR